MLAAWERSKDAPANQANIHFPFGETMWVDVLEHRGEGKFVVRLRNSSVLEKSLKAGSYLLADWNGTRRDGLTGRALLQPVCRMAKPPRKRKSRAA